MHKSILEYVILWKMYTQAPIISPFLTFTAAEHSK